MQNDPCCTKVRSQSGEVPCFAAERHVQYTDGACDVHGMWWVDKADPASVAHAATGPMLGLTLPGPDPSVPAWIHPNTGYVVSKLPAARRSEAMSNVDAALASLMTIESEDTLEGDVAAAATRAESLLQEHVQRCRRDHRSLYRAKNAANAHRFSESLRIIRSDYNE